MKHPLRVGFIGLGLMGNLMAKNILKKGFPLIVYNRTYAKTLELKKLGAEVALSPKELAKRVDVVITMVTGPSDVQDVLFKENSVTEWAKKGLIVIDMSTIGPTAAKEIAEKLTHKSIHFLDAPVTGSTPKAKTGELTIFIGGEKEIFEKVKPVLESMGTNLQYVGPVGSGQAVKLINNQIGATTIVGLAEGMILADAMGISRESVAKALSSAPVVSPFMLLKMQNYISNTFPLLFTTKNMRKDLGLASKEARKDKRNLPLLRVTENLHKKGLRKFGNQDYSILIKLLNS